MTERIPTTVWLDVEDILAIGSIVADERERGHAVTESGAVRIALLAAAHRIAMQRRKRRRAAGAPAQRPPAEG